MMKNYYLFVFIAIFSISAVHNGALAGRPDGFMRYIFTPEMAEYDRPYMNKHKNAYNSDWEYPHWRPELWAQDTVRAQEVIDGFYASGVLMDQKIKDDMPVLEVGQRFLDLSGRDQRRVVKFVAYAFGIDGMTGKGAMRIVLDEDCLIDRFCDGVPLGEYYGGQVQLH